MLSRAYGTRKYLNTSLFLLTTFGPIYYYCMVPRSRRAIAPCVGGACTAVAAEDKRYFARWLFRVVLLSPPFSLRRTPGERHAFCVCTVEQYKRARCGYHTLWGDFSKGRLSRKRWMQIGHDPSA